MMCLRILVLSICLCCVHTVLAQKLVPFREGDRWGYSDRSGKVVIPCTFERTVFFDGELARVKKQGKWGLLDRSGALFLPCAYDIVYGALKEGRIVVCRGGDKDGHHGSWGMVPRYQGREIPLEFELMRECGIPGLLGVYREGKWGVLNQFAKIAVPMHYEVEALSMHQLMPPAGDISKSSVPLNVFPQGTKKYLKLRFERGIARVRKDEKWGYINAQGAEVIPVKYSFVGEFSEGLLCVVKKVGQQLKMGFVDRNHTMRIPCRYDFVEDAYRHIRFEGGIVPVRLDGKWGYISTENEVVIPFQYAQASVFRKGVALVSHSVSSLLPVWKCINMQGDVLFTLREGYQLPEAFFSGDFLRVKYQGKETYLNRQGQQIGAFYQKVYPFRNGLAQVVAQREGGLKTGFINTKGEEVIPVQYDCGDTPHEVPRWGRYLFPKKNGRRGVIDTKNQQIISFSYEDLLLPPEKAFHLNFLAVKQEGRWGFINTKEKWLIPPKYEKVANFTWKYALVYIQGKAGYINRKGKEYFK